MPGFNIRVYGLLIREEHILLVDESIGGHPVTKFPGGGLEFGEGPEDCMKREALEELGEEVTILEHFYTTGFFQPSAFRKDDQVISIYYHINTEALLEDIEVREAPCGLEKASLVFRWKALANLREEDVTFPIDQVVVKKLIEER